jgi:hypothetical protein
MYTAKRVINRSLTSLICLLLLTAVALAQQTDNGSLSGVVRDQNGAVVPGASVTATSVHTGLKRTATSDSDGRWTLPTLKPGDYDITIAAKDFAETKQRVSVTASVTTPVDVTLGLTGVDLQITVVADNASTITDTSSTAPASTFTGKDLEKGPLPVRNALTAITTNTQVAGDIADPLVAGTGNPEISVAGGRTTSVGLLKDGVDATNVVGTGSLTENIAPSPEMVQEVKLLTNFDASLGRTGGGNVQIVTRNGGQDFHGAVFMFAQNEFFNANDFFFNRDGIDRQKASRFEGGFTLGGPVIKERLFFFGGYQRTDATTAYVPTAQSFVVLPEALALLTTRTPQDVARAFGLARRDNPAGVPNPNSPGTGFFQNGCIISRPYLPSEISTTPQQILNSVGSRGICINTLSPFFRLLTLQSPVTGDFLIPTLRPGYQRLIADPVNTVYGTDISAIFPNGVPVTDSGRESGFGALNPLVRQRNAFPALFEQDQFTVRLDSELSKGDASGKGKNEINGTFFFANFPISEPFSEATLASPFPLLKDDRNRTLAITDRHYFTPMLINEVRFGYFSLSNSRSLDPRLLASQFTNDAFGIPNPASFFVPGPESQRCAHQSGRGNLQDFSACAPNDIFNRREQLTLTFANNVTWIKRAHSLRFGVEHKRNFFDTSLPEEQGGEFEKYDNFGLALVGYATEADTAFGTTDKKFRFNDLSFYITDDWRPSNRLTLTIGLRWDLFGRPQEKLGRFTNFDPGLVTNPEDPRPGFILPSNSTPIGVVAVDSSLPTINKSNNSHTLEGQDLNNFAPRFGFRYALGKDDKTSVSGGYGIFYDRPSASFINTVYSNYPYLREIEERVEQIPFSIPYNLVFGNQSPTRSISDYLPFRVGLNPNTSGNGTQLALYDNTQIIGAGRFAEPLEFRAVERNLKTPMVQQWNLGIQHTFGKDLVVEARYLGSRGQNLLLAVGFNQPYDLNSLSTPDYIFKRLNDAYVQAGSPQGALRTGAVSERQRGCGISFGNVVTITPNPGFPYPFGPACTAIAGNFDYNLDRGPAIGDARDIINAELRVPYLGFDPTDAVMLQSRGYSIYHSGSVNASKRLSRSFSANFSYTFSKSIDIGSTDPGSTTASGRPDTPNLGLVVQGDQRDINSNRAVSDFDRTHRAVGSFTWDLPFSDSKKKLLSGWQLSGLGQWQSGSPFSIFGTDVEPVALSDSSLAQAAVFLGQFTLTGIVLTNPTTGQRIITTRTITNVGRSSGLLFDAAFGRPNVANFDLLLRRNCDDITRCYFNTNQRGNDAALVAPYGRFGNLGRNVLRGPSQRRVDFSLRKNTKLTERFELEFKWDVFNVFNFVNFANPNADLTDETDFGQITRTVGAPRVMQFGAKLRF